METPKIESFVVSNYFDSGWSGSIVYKMGQNELRVKMPPCLAEALARQVIAQHEWIMNDKANPKQNGLEFHASPCEQEETCHGDFWIETHAAEKSWQTRQTGQKKPGRSQEEI